MMWGDGWGGWGSWIFGALMMLIFWGGLVVLVILAVRGFGSGSWRGREEPKAPNPKDILAERFARGEFSEEEFEQRRRLLERRAS